MKVVTAIIAWLLIVIIGSIVSAFAFEADAHLLFMFGSLIYSAPSAVVFIGTIFLIIGRTKFSRRFENVLLIAIHLLLTLVTFIVIIGQDTNRLNEFNYPMFLSFASVGAVVWFIYLSSVNKTKAAS